MYAVLTGDSTAASDSMLVSIDGGAVHSSAERQQ
jgi:hypothetical protein